MKSLLPIGLLTLSLALVACSSDDDPQSELPNDTSSSSSGGNDQSSSSSGGNDQSSSSSGGNDQSSSSGGSSSGGTEEPTEMCTAARGEALQEQTTVSGGQVAAVTGDNGEGTLLWIQAHGGGSNATAATQARVYVKLAGGSKVEVSDVAAQSSTEWDLAFKRTNIFTNSGVGGPGEGGAQLIEKPFAEVTAADATAIATEAFFNDDCELIKRTYPEYGGFADPYTFQSTMNEWYSYSLEGHGVTARDDTYVVRAAAGGKLFKVKIESYAGNQDGTAGETNGNLLVRVAELN